MADNETRVLPVKGKLFDTPDVRCYWCQLSNEWYYSIMDVISLLTKSSNPQREIEQLKSNAPFLRRTWKDMVKYYVVPNKDGQKHRIAMMCTSNILRVIIGLRTPQADPYKMWLCIAAYDQYNFEETGED